MAGRLMPYIVRQGDYLAKLAFVKGFDADEVWNDPRNEDLRKLRPDPNILAPGDILYVPDTAPNALPIQKGTENSYSAAVPNATVRVTFIGADGPWSNEAYVVEGLGTSTSGQAAGDGSVELQIPVHTREVSIGFPGKGIKFPLRIGDMDPVEERSGMMQRLQNLGYLSPSVSSVEGPDADACVRYALATFQTDNGLPASGEFDQTTSDTLVNAHDG